MKNAVLILLLVFVCWGCSDESSPDYKKLIGCIHFQMQTKYENGAIAQEFTATGYLPNTKVELLRNGISLETTSAIKDGKRDAFFILQRLEYNKEYTVRISLNEYYICESKPFTVYDSNMSFYTPEMFNDDFMYYPQWLESGDYYLDFLYLKDSSIIIRAWDTTGNISQSPNPVLSYMMITANIPKSTDVKIDILDFQLNIKDTISNGYFQAGVYDIMKHKVGYTDGLYILRMQRDGNEYIHTFIVGDIFKKD